MSIKSSLPVLVAALLAVCPHATAQEAPLDEEIQESPSGLTAGALAFRPVRLRSSAVDDGKLIQGYVTALDDSTLSLRVLGRPPVQVPVASISSLEIKTGNDSRLVAGAISGAIVGGLIGLAVPADGTCHDRNNQRYQCLDKDDARVVAVVGLAAVVGGIGAGIGALLKVEQWMPFELRGTDVSVQVQPGGASVTIGF